MGEARGDAKKDVILGDKDPRQRGFRVAACGSQSQSQRITEPAFSFGRQTREHREKLFLTEDHIRTQQLGRQSPKGGAIYDTEKGKRSGPAHVFGTGPQRDLLVRKDDEGDIASNDVLQVDVDSQLFKYKREPEIIIGTQPRGQLKDATLLHNHSVAFYGRASPGPAVPGQIASAVEKTKSSVAPARSFRPKLPEQMRWLKTSDNPPEVGPGSYPRKDDASEAKKPEEKYAFTHPSIGQQHLTKRRNQPVNAFTHAPKFPKTLNADQISKLDVARSSLGKQVLHRNRSEPSINFAADNRDTRAKSMLCMTKADMGPKANLPKMRLSMPALPMERSIMTGGLG